MMGRPDAALKELRLSKNEVGACAIGQVGLGHPYFVQRKFDLALTQYVASTVLERDQWLGYFWEGRTFEEMGDFPKAIESFEQADLRTVGYDTTLGAADAVAGAAKVKAFYKKLLDACLQGSDGYWKKRLDLALHASPQDPHYIATVYAHLKQMPEAYQWLEAARQQGKLDELYLDVCWNRDDPAFQEIVGKIGQPR
jgi:tetratricopeptide (TPR) repeat protein